MYIYYLRRDNMKTAKIFMSGHSQAVRLPKEFRFDGKEVFIYQEHKTQNIILSRKPTSWDGFFELQEEINIPENFLKERNNEIDKPKDLF